QQPLSQSLEALLGAAENQTALTLNQLVERTGGRGIYLFLTMVSLPFIVPIPLPGFSLVVGVIILLSGLRMALGLPPKLPLFIGKKSISVERQRKILAASVRLVKWIERMVKPRGRDWIANEASRRAHGLLIAFMGLLLTLPLPIVFTNSLPGLAVIFVCVSMMEEDALLIWAGYVFAAGSVIYLLALSKIIIALFERYSESVRQFLGI
ncbi:MAG: Exopolysaccharide synthesis, ExoD, partial [Verrucomicrobia bacterium]|nr:Exopolysaccharide synthesis, ExoD [Verrucomicrobiota bacterium]